MNQSVCDAIVLQYLVEARQVDRVLRHVDLSARDQSYRNLRLTRSTVIQNSRISDNLDETAASPVLVLPVGGRVPGCAQISGVLYLARFSNFK